MVLEESVQALSVTRERLKVKFRGVQGFENGIKVAALLEDMESEIERNEKRSMVLQAHSDPARIAFEFVATNGVNSVAEDVWVYARSLSYEIRRRLHSIIEKA